MPAELGQTSNPKDLIPGEPERISSDLRDLVGNIQLMGGIKDDLGGIDPAQWVGEASDAFRAVFGAEPSKWEQAIATVGDKATALADFGDVLTWGQSEAQRAIEAFTQAQAASRTAAAQYNAQAQQAQAAGQTMDPFQDPGQAAAQEAQQILDNAREKVETVGGLVARALGFSKNDDGSYTKKLGGKDFGADEREKVKKWDPEKGEWVEEDPGGWQKNKGGRSYSREFGSQSDGMFTDNIKGVLDALGIDTSESTVAASANVDLLHGSLEGQFDNGAFSGSGKLDGSVLGAGAEAHGSASILGLAGGASAEAYLAKGHAEGELNAGPASLKGSADGFVGAEAKADGQIGWTGAQASAEAFAGARVSGDASAEVAGVTAGVHGEAWAGAGAEASGQIGMGDDGKFHLGASVGIGLGVGAKVGFDISVDPAAVVDTVENVAEDVGHVAADVGHGIANAAADVGHFLGF
ncbi:putative T7SS-secreted protein [Kutzneria sp. NPDC052558]|uniref:putative T7SS-secreted protein n=1 Tax=Kutzneria sp. NPDC052558 TaxID=3364121 RepID=UPI0037CACD71